MTPDSLLEADGTAAETTSPPLVREVGLPAGAESLGTLGRVDYSDAFVFPPGAAADRTPLEWMRAVIEGAPPSFRTTAPRTWFALGLKHGSPDSPDCVLGWPVLRDEPDHALLGAGSRLGMPGQLLLRREGDELLFATLIRFGNPAMRGVWGLVAPHHRRVVAGLIGRAAREAGG